MPCNMAAAAVRPSGAAGNPAAPQPGTEADAVAAAAR